MADSKKRKEVTRDVQDDAAVVSGDEFDFVLLDGAFSDSEFATNESAVEEDGVPSSKDDKDDGETSFASEEIPSEDGGQLLQLNRGIPVCQPLRHQKGRRGRKDRL